MGSGLGSWVDANWLALLGVVVGVWVPFALRSPPARIRYWTTTESITFIGGVTETRLALQNVGDSPVTFDQWRSPLSVECSEEIQEVKVSGVSHADIQALAHPEEGDPKRVTLHVNRLDPGDVVAFDIRHDKIRQPPKVSGEIRGAPGALVPALTASQRMSVIPGSVVILSLLYVEMASIVWMTELKLNTSGVIRGTIFALASALPGFAVTPFIGRRVKREHPTRVGCLFLLAGSIEAVFAIVATVISGLDGYRLWYPEFAVWAILALSLQRFITRTPFAAKSGIAAAEEWRGNSSVSTFFTDFACVVFGVTVALNESAGVEIWVGVVTATTYAISNMDSHSFSRLKRLFGNPTDNLLLPGVADASVGGVSRNENLPATRVAEETATGSPFAVKTLEEGMPALSSDAMHEDTHRDREETRRAMSWPFLVTRRRSR